jgi:hypothetical protein
MNPLDLDLVHWRSLPERKQALEFTAQGWALAEACALHYKRKPQAFVVHMLGEIISGIVDDTRQSGPELNIEWQRPTDGLTASIAFQTRPLTELAGICDMELGELQSAIQNSFEGFLLELYNQFSNKQRLH